MSLSIIPPSSIHIVANGKISFFFIAEWYSSVYLYHIFFIHSSVDGHLGSFHDLAIVDSTSINTGGHVPQLALLYESALLYPLDKFLVVLLLGCAIFNFLRILHTVF